MAAQRFVKLAVFAVTVLAASAISSSPALATSPPEVTASFADAQIPLGGGTTFSVAIGNPNADTAITGAGFLAELPRGVVVADAPDVADSCGGTVDAPAGASTVTLSGGAVERDQLCEVSFAVTASWSGEKSAMVDTSSDQGAGNQSTASTTVLPPAPGARAYWSGAPVSFANLDGSGGGDLPAHGATVSGGSGIALDPAAGRVYWANGGAGKISYANLDGSGGGDLDTGHATVLGPDGLVIDEDQNRIYWANSAANQISYANLDGSGGTELDTGTATVDGPAGVAIDPAHDRICWANSLGSEAIACASLDGTGGHDIPTTGATVDNPAGVAIDPVQNRVYWANQGINSGPFVEPGSISYANLDGSGGGVLPISASLTKDPVGVAIDPAQRRIYWASFDTGAISFANLDGGDPGSIRTLGGGITLLALLEPPAAAAAPIVGGGTAPGTTLTCSSGWAPDVPESLYYRAPRRLAYRWSRDGVPIAGATRPQLVADAPGSYRCAVTATNVAGSASSESAARDVRPAPPAQAVTRPAGPPRPSCRIAARGNRVLLGAARRHGRRRGGRGRVPGTLRLVIRCDTAAHVKLVAKTIVARGHGRRHARAFSSRAVRGYARARAALTLTVRLPNSALTRLANGAREAVTLSLVARNAAGARTTTLRIRRLRPLS